MTGGSIWAKSASGYQSVPDFDPRTYGHGKLSDLVVKSGSFEIDRQAGRFCVSA